MVWKTGKPLQNAQYFIEEVLGQGGFGIAYKAWDAEHSEHVVIKTLSEERQNDPNYRKYVERFKQEGQWLTQLGTDPYPHIVRARDLFDEAEIPCLVMDFIDGQDLWDYVESQGPLREIEALKYVCQIGEALTMVHQAGLVHRDAHPGNIILRPDGKAVLVDFGLAGEIIPIRNTYDHYAHGSFAPYEQQIGSREPTVDVYTLAATLYFAITRQFPPSCVDRKEKRETLVPPQQHQPRISNTLNQAILIGMEVEAKDRPQSMSEWLKLLRGEATPDNQAISVELRNRRYATINQPYYISRKPAEDFLARFAKAMKQPESQPLLFHIYGFGGVGKTTLTRKLKETHEQQAEVAEVSFGLTKGIETPVKLMAKLYEQLSEQELLEADPFTSLNEQYQQTIHKLKNQPVEGEAADAAQLSTVENWCEFGSLTLLSAANVNSSTMGTFDGLVRTEGMLGDAPHAIASAKERMQQLLQQHPATKNDKELQALMLEPIPKLTQAFAKGLIQKAQKQKRSVVLILDTYEKVATDIDTWLWQYLLEDTPLKSYPIRLIMAGRRSLLEKESWRKLQQDRDLICERRLAEFDKDQTKAYLQKIGITQPKEMQQIYKATKGLPYYLDWIRREREAGRDIDFSRGNQAIVELLLQGLNAKQKQIVQLAACCRWFDRSLIQHLMEQQEIDFRAVDTTLSCFDWLRQRDFVEFVQGRHRLDDVARDVFRLSLWLEDKNQFRQNHELLSSYFGQQANKEVLPDSPDPEKYENSDWRQYTAELLYHALFARKNDGYRQFLSHFFASRYLNEIEVVNTPFAAIAAEAAVEDYRLLPNDTDKLLKSLKLVFPFGWMVLDAYSPEYTVKYEKTTGPSKEKIEAALEPCFNQVDSLDDGLSKYAGLLYKSKRCRNLDRRVQLLMRAKMQAEGIMTATHPQFSSSLFRKVGIELNKLDRYEEALACFDKAIGIQPDFHIPWFNRGHVLSNLGCYEEALASCDKAIELKPDDSTAWNGQGHVLNNLGRYEEALSSCDKAIELKPDNSTAWVNRGVVLNNLGCYEEALASCDKAIELKPDDSGVWNNRGRVLDSLGRYEEALSSCDKAIELKPDDSGVWNNRGLTLSFLGRYEEALANYKEALKLQPKFPLLWANRGIVLARSGCYEEALASCEKALELQPNDESGYYGKACCYALQGDVKLAIDNLRRAINLNPERCRREAKNNPDFDSIRASERFQTLLEERIDRADG